MRKMFINIMRHDNCDIGVQLNIDQVVFLDDVKSCQQEIYIYNMEFKIK